MIRLSGTAADAAGAGAPHGGARGRGPAPFSVPGGTVRMSRKNPFGDVSDKRFRGMAGLSQIFSTFGGQNSTQ